MNALPLAGLKVLVTRPRDQLENLVSLIAQAGGVAVCLPLLEIAPVNDSKFLHTQLMQANDWAIFVSPNAVRYGLAAIAAAHASLPPKVAAVGLGSARALREAGVTSVVAPSEQFDSEGLLAMPELAQMSGQRVLIFRGDGGRELLADTLQKRGAIVDYASCYVRRKTELNEAMLQHAAPDVLTVTSSEALTHLRDALSENSAWLALPLFAPHPRIAVLAHQQGWTHVVTTASGDEGLLAGLIACRNTKETI